MGLKSGLEEMLVISRRMDGPHLSHYYRRTFEKLPLFHEIVGKNTLQMLTNATTFVDHKKYQLMYK